MAPILIVCAVVAGFPATVGEQLAVVRPDGVVIAVLNGDAANVVITPEVDAELKRPGSDLLLTHNHPGSLGLSALDLGQLAKRGVRAIEAVGSDGSRYEASAGSRYNQYRFEERQYRMALDVVTASLRQASGAAVNPALFDDHLAHLVAIALSKAAIIRYNAVLSPARARFCERWRAVLGQATEMAAARLKRT